jgi:hypothetical protein
MRTIALLLAFSSWACAQLDDNTITVTASRNVIAAPALMSITTSVGAPFDARLDDVMAIVQPAGITLGDLSSVYAYSPDRGSTWTFRRNVADKEQAAALAALEQIRQQLTRNRVQEYWLSYSLDSMPGAAECPLPALVSDARAQAKRVADVTGVKVGPVFALTHGEVTAGTPTYAYFAVYNPATAVAGSGAVAGSYGSVGLASFLIGVPSLYFVPPPSTCSISVQFKLLR